MSTITDTLKSFDDFVSLPPAKTDDISNAQKSLSLEFAPEYREYLTECAAAAANGHELTGVVNSDRLNVVCVTKTEWGLNKQIPHNMYVIENAAIDGIIIWQDKTGAVYKSTPKTPPVKICSSLAEFIVC